jgi:predicted DNA-binding transcriptional regulator YafY
VGRNDDKIEDIILSFTPHQGQYIKSLPLHSSQTVLVDDDNELRISLHLYVTHDLIMKLLSYAANMKVIQPQSLADQLKQAFIAAAKRYE